MQCFRHCTDEAIEERQGYSEEQKNFFVDYGLTIVKAIQMCIRDSHNHPSSDLQMSVSDRNVTEKMMYASLLLDI